MTRSSKLFINMITPSTLGIVCYITVILAILADDEWASYSHSITNVQVSDFQGTFLYSPIVHFSSFLKLHFVSDVTLYIFWLIIAAVIFFLATKLVSNADDVAGGIKMRHYIWPEGADADRPLKEFIERLFFHLSMFIILVIYLVRVPSAIKRWMQTHSTHFALTGKSLEDTILLIFFLALAMHVFVILLRLLFTRKRLFGG